MYLMHILSTRLKTKLRLKVTCLPLNYDKGGKGENLRLISVDPIYVDMQTSIKFEASEELLPMDRKTVPQKNKSIYVNS